ncbi:MAG: uroporphyrinogen decarboxylase [Gammaproteobacteria bacterium]|nr:MAG: uroporphyrinogen decarboxylase [Gammaproteobacteria bacterium]
MKERWLTVAADAQAKRQERFRIWREAEHVPFSSPAAIAVYQEKVDMLVDALSLEKKPKRIPVCPSPGFYPVQYGGISFRDAHYDNAKLAVVWEKYYDEFQPDTYNTPGNLVSGKILDLLDYRLYKWAGAGIGNDKSFQYIEKEYMKADEYQDFIDDPTGYMLSVYFPRIAGNLAPLAALPLIPAQLEIPMISAGVRPFGTPEFSGLLQKLTEAGQEVNDWFKAQTGVNLKIMGKGYPTLYGGFSKAPLDAIGDSMRGTVGVMMDIYKRPDLLLEACERMVPFMIKIGVASTRASGNPLVFMPLHKGADSFMSQAQFDKFYWPSFRKVLIGLINDGCVPLLFAEGSYNKRLEAIRDLPKGSVIWWFDQTDMIKAKETLGDVACIMGNVPLSLMCTGTPESVTGYCRNLIDKVGRDGGYIMSTGAGFEDVKADNVRAMISFCKEYGA